MWELCSFHAEMSCKQTVFSLSLGCVRNPFVFVLKRDFVAERVGTENRASSSCGSAAGPCKIVVWRQVPQPESVLESKIVASTGTQSNGSLVDPKGLRPSGHIKRKSIVNAMQASFFLWFARLSRCFECSSWWTVNHKGKCHKDKSRKQKKHKEKWSQGEESHKEKVTGKNKSLGGGAGGVTEGKSHREDEKSHREWEEGDGRWNITGEEKHHNTTQQLTDILTKGSFTRNRWTLLVLFVNITTHTTFTQRDSSASYAVVNPLFSSMGICGREYFAFMVCTKQKSSQLLRTDCEGNWMTRMPTWTIAQYLHHVAKLEATPSVKNYVSKIFKSSPQRRLVLNFEAEEATGADWATGSDKIRQTTVRGKKNNKSGDSMIRQKVSSLRNRRNMYSFRCCTASAPNLERTPTPSWLSFHYSDLESVCERLLGKDYEDYKKHGVEWKFPTTQVLQSVQIRMYHKTGIHSVGHELHW